MAWFYEEVGEVIDRICQAAPPHVLQTARDFHYYLGDRLKASGFQVRREVRCDYFHRNRNGSSRVRKGRIDLVITGIEPVGIEIDWRSPRQKSIWKLMAFKGHKIIVIREPKDVRSWPYLSEISLIDVDREE